MPERDLPKEIDSIENALTPEEAQERLRKIVEKPEKKKKENRKEPKGLDDRQKAA